MSLFCRRLLRLRSEEVGELTPTPDQSRCLGQRNLSLSSQWSIRQQFVEASLGRRAVCRHHHPQLENREQPPPDVPGLPLMARTCSCPSRRSQRWSWPLPLLSCSDQARSQHAGDGDRIEPHESGPARGNRRAFGAHRQPDFRRSAHARRQPECGAGTGRALGDSRSADLHFSSASRREVSRRAPAHLARCEVDLRFPAHREDSQHQGGGISLCRSHRCARTISRSYFT